MDSCFKELYKIVFRSTFVIRCPLLASGDRMSLV
jgi:hypothetical protein